MKLAKQQRIHLQDMASMETESAMSESAIERKFGHIYQSKAKVMVELESHGFVESAEVSDKDMIVCGWVLTHNGRMEAGAIE